jgi:hypothetical protein
VVAELGREYDTLEHQLRMKLQQLRLESSGGWAEQEKLVAQRELLQTEKAALRGLAARGAISNAVQQWLTASLDQQLQQLGRSKPLGFIGFQSG